MSSYLNKWVEASGSSDETIIYYLMAFAVNEVTKETEDQLLDLMSMAASKITADPVHPPVQLLLLTCRVQRGY